MPHLEAKKYVAARSCDLDESIKTAAPPVDNTKFARWSRYGRKSMVIIGLSLSDEILYQVRDCNTSREMRRCIQNVTKRHTLLNHLAARRIFHTDTMMVKEKMLCYINRVKQLCFTLKSMEVEVDDKEFAMAVLC